jgi:hypothetical protein
VQPWVFFSRCLWFFSLFRHFGVVCPFHGLVVFSSAVFRKHLVGVVSIREYLLCCALNSWVFRQIALVVVNQIQRCVDIAHDLQVDML